MNILIMNYIKNASHGEKFLLQEFLKKRFDSISEQEILHWIVQIKNNNGLENSISHLYSVVDRAIKLSQCNLKLQEIVKFVINQTLNRISSKIK